MRLPLLAFPGYRALAIAPWLSRLGYRALAIAPWLSRAQIVAENIPHLEQVCAQLIAPLRTSFDA